MRRRTTRIGVGLLAVALCSSVGLPLGLHAAPDAVPVRLERLPARSAATVRARAGETTTHALPYRADMLGATWSGPAEAVELRTRTRAGGWSSWVELHAEGDGPDRASAEGQAVRRRGYRAASTPMWVGAADVVQLRPHHGARATDLRVVAIDATGVSRRERPAGRIATLAARMGLGGVPDAAAQPASPPIQRREAWGAIASKAAPVDVAAGVQGVVVHHTASTNRYACSQVPAILRGIQLYHMRTNGWNDIGYNFLIDACGGVWEGRGGGVTRAILGAHTAGFNTGTVGIALIGTHGAAKPTVAARRALERLIAWRLDLAHVKPTGRTSLIAASSDKFPAGSRVSVRAVSGHRDLFPTSCPGAMAYGQLDAIARTAWSRGGVKVASITRTATLRAPADPFDASLARVSVRAIGSQPGMRLGVRILRTSTGEVLHSAAVTGTVITTAWVVPDALRVPDWDTHIEVTGTLGTQRARPAIVPVVQVPLDPALAIVSPPAASVTPGGDPVDDLVSFAYTLGQDFRMAVTLHDPATGATVGTLMAPRYVGPTTSGTAATLALHVPASVPAGTWELRIALPADTARGRSVYRAPLTVVR